MIGSMKRNLLAVAVVLGAMMAGCSSSPYQQSGDAINEPAGAEINPAPTNLVEPKARDANPQPYWQPWQVPQ